MPSDATAAAEPPLLLLRRRLRALRFHRSGAAQAERRQDEDDEEEEEEEEEDERQRPRAMMAAALPPGPGPGAAVSGERAALPRWKSVNTTECVAVASSEHVAEIVGRQGCKIKALRAKTNTYIKTPLRSEAPVFVVTGRRQDVATAKREIQSAAEHFSLLRASRGCAAVPGAPCWAAALPGQTTVPVRVPYRVVGLVVGPKGATIKRIQQQTHTYIVTPGRDSQPVFEVTGTPENVDRARQEIELHIALRTGAFPDRRDLLAADAASEGSPAWLRLARAGTAAGYRHDSSSSLGSRSTDSPFGPPADFSPTSPFGAGGFWLGAEEPPPDSPAGDALPAASPPLWAPLEPAAPLPGPGWAWQRGSRPPTPRLSPASLEGPEPPAYAPAFSTGTGSYSSSNGGSSASSSPPECRRLLCLQPEPTATVVPCGHGLLCPRGAAGAHGKACPVCHAAGTQALHIGS